MAKLKFNPPGYQDLGAYALLKNVVENEHLIAEDSSFPYKVYSALLSQQEVYLESGPLVVGTKYVILELGSGDDFSNVGYVSDNVPFIATGDTPTTWSNGTYVYDYAASKPTATILQNTLGDLNFEYVYTNLGLGGYLYGIAVESNGLFTPNKTFVICGSGSPLTGTGLRAGGKNFEAPAYPLPNAFTLFGSSVGPLYDIKDMPIEIRVYP